MDHHDKLSWAGQHLHALDLEIKDFLKRHAFTARGEQRDGSREFDIIVDQMRPLPPHWPLMAGDAIQNIRTALDHIIWTFTLRSRTPPNREQSKKIGFPVCADKGAYWGKRDQRGNGARDRQAGWIGDEALAIVDRVQPCHGGDDPDEHPLAVIVAYSNEDKHRNLVATAVLATSVQFRFEMVGTTRPQKVTTFSFGLNPDRRLYSNANLGVLVFGEGTTCDPGEMAVKPIFSGNVAFGMKRPAPLFDVVSLEKVLDSIYREVIVPLDEILWR